jgi:uncharacterized membrane-anchored protein YhcB (DUF1043 family)
MAWHDFIIGLMNGVWIGALIVYLDLTDGRGE